MGIFTDHVKANADRVIATIEQIEPALDNLCADLNGKVCSSTISKGGLIIYIDTLDYVDGQYSKERGVSALQDALPGWRVSAPEGIDHQWASANTLIDGVKLDVTVFCRA